MALFSDDDYAELLRATFDLMAESLELADENDRLREALRSAGIDPDE